MVFYFCTTRHPGNIFENVSELKEPGMGVFLMVWRDLPPMDHIPMVLTGSIWGIGKINQDQNNRPILKGLIKYNPPRYDTSYHDTYFLFK